eukprot:1007988-Rhodomonas_salina.2
MFWSRFRFPVLLAPISVKPDLPSPPSDVTRASPEISPSLVTTATAGIARCGTEFTSALYKPPIQTRSESDLLPVVRSRGYPGTPGHVACKLQLLFGWEGGLR